MNTQQMFVITKSGLSIRPEGIDLSLAYTKYFIQDARAKLDEYILVSPCTSFDDPIFAEAQREICRAEDIMRELEATKGHLIRVYDRNFQDWAEVFRQTRLELGLEKVEDSPELYAAVKHVMAMLRAKNPKFSESKFIPYINKGAEATYDDVKLDKRIYEPRTGFNHTSRYNAQIRRSGWAQDEAFFDTREKAQAWLDNNKYDGTIGESVKKDYEAVFRKWARKAQEGQIDISKGGANE